MNFRAKIYSKIIWISILTGRRIGEIYFQVPKLDTRTPNHNCHSFYAKALFLLPSTRGKNLDSPVNTNTCHNPCRMQYIQGFWDGTNSDTSPARIAAITIPAFITAFARKSCNDLFRNRTNAKSETANKRSSWRKTNSHCFETPMPGKPWPRIEFCAKW